MKTNLHRAACHGTEQSEHKDRQRDNPTWQQPNVAMQWSAKNAPAPLQYKLLNITYLHILNRVFMVTSTH